MVGRSRPCHQSCHLSLSLLLELKGGRMVQRQPCSQPPHILPAARAWAPDLQAPSSFPCCRQDDLTAGGLRSSSTTRIRRAQVPHRSTQFITGLCPKNLFFQFYFRNQKISLCVPACSSSYPTQPILSSVGQVTWAQMSQADSYDLVQHYFIITT